MLEVQQPQIRPLDEVRNRKQVANLRKWSGCSSKHALGVVGGDLTEVLLNFCYLVSVQEDTF